MKRIFHRTSNYVTPMMVVDADPDTIVKHVWKTSTSIREEDRQNPDFVVLDCESCNLDPGGRARANKTYQTFTIEGNTFSVELAHIEGVLRHMSLAVERVPGYVRFTNWNGWANSLIYMSVGLFNALKIKLNELLMTSETLHANLGFNNGMESIRKFNQNINNKCSDK